MSERGGAGATEITILPSNEPQNNIVRRRTEKIITVMWRREIGNAAIKKEILFAWAPGRFRRASSGGLVWGGTLFTYSSNYQQIFRGEYWRFFGANIGGFFFGKIENMYFRSFDHVIIFHIAKNIQPIKIYSHLASIRLLPASANSCVLFITQFGLIDVCFFGNVEEWLRGKAVEGTASLNRILTRATTSIMMPWIAWKFLVIIRPQ